MARILVVNMTIVIVGLHMVKLHDTQDTSLEFLRSHIVKNSIASAVYPGLAA